jgi:hypothetical protein
MKNPLSRAAGTEPLQAAVGQLGDPTFSHGLTSYLHYLTEGDSFNRVVPVPRPEAKA